MKRSLLFLLLCVGCSASRADIHVVSPEFAALVDLPDLAGVVTVRQDGLNGEVVGRATVAIDGESFTASVPRLPLGRDLYVTLEWTSAGLLVAATAGNVVRVEADKATSLDIGLGDYVYPDSDNDGAQNIFEVGYAASHPADGADAATNPLVAPTGFFNRFAASYVMPSFGFAAAVDATAGNILVPTFDVDNTVTIFSNHAVQLVDQTTRQRYTTPLTCPSNSALFDIVQATFERAAVLCKRATGTAASDNALIVDSTTTGAPVIVRSAATPGADSLFHAAGANEVYAVGTDVLYVIDLYATSPVVDTIDVGRDVGQVQMVYGVDAGAELLITDAIENSLIVVSKVNDVWTSARVLSGVFDGPQQIVVHPTGRRAYVTNAADGYLRVIDITSPDPALWSLITAVQVGSDSTALAIEPVTGSFVYATSNERMVRIDTVTNVVGWSFEPGGANALADVSLSDDGRFGVLVTDRAVFALGFGTSDGLEAEPNESVGQSENKLVVPGSSFGWGDSQEDGSLWTTWTWENAGSRQQSDDDFEDVWRLEPGGEERVAIALIPAHNFTNLAVALVDTEVRDTAFYWGIGVSHAISGNGVLLVTPPLASAPQNLSVAVSMFDLGQASTPYELAVAALPAVIPSVAELEPNNSWDEAQIITAVLPVQVAGFVDAAEIGVSNGRPPPNDDDLEDCYRVSTHHRRLAVRLDPTTATADVNLLPFDASSTRLPGSVYFLDSPGESEFVILEPQPSLPEVMLCVGIRDSDAVTQSSYTLLLVDLGT